MPDIDTMAEVAKQGGLVPKRRRKPPRVPRQRIPRTLQARYYSKIYRLLKPARDLVKAKLFPVLPSIATSAGLVPGRADAAAWLDRLDRTMGEVQEAYGQLVTDDDVETVAAELPVMVERWQRAEGNKVFRSLIGIDVFESTEGLAEVMEVATRENVALIKSISTEYFGEIEKIVMRNVRAGVRAENFASEVEAASRGQWKKGINRAKLIARDQTNKAYGDINRVRQTQMGVTSYIWRTSQDERVRESHLDLEGLSFTWEKGSDEGHPGQPIQCRCTAEPDLSHLGKDFAPEDTGEEYNKRVRTEVKAKLKKAEKGGYLAAWKKAELRKQEKE